MDLLLGQFNPRIYRVADPIQESLSRACRLDVADSSLLEKSRARSGKAVLRDTVGTEIRTKPSIGPSEVGSRTTAVVLVPENGGEQPSSLFDVLGRPHFSLMSLTSSSRLAWTSDLRCPLSINHKRISESDQELQRVSRALL